MRWRLVYLGERDQFECAAFSEAFIKARFDNLTPDTFYVFQPAESTVHYGRDGDLSKVKHKFCMEHGIKVVRYRHPNPDPMYFDKSSFLMYIIYRPSEIIPADVEMLRVQQGIVNALAVLGINAEIKRGGNDVLIDGKKVSGIANITYKDIQVSKFFLNADFDFEVAENSIVSKHDLRESVTTLKNKIGHNASPEEILGALRRGFEPILSAEFDMEYELTETEKAIVEGLRDKYTSEQWIKTGRWSPVKEYGRPK